MSPINVEIIFAPGCDRCAESREALKAAAQEVGHGDITWREVNILDEMDYAVDLGVIAPPSIAIDGELVFPSLPTPAKLRDELLKRMKPINSPA